MVRTQIQLTEEQAALIKQIAAERRLSMAEVIRQGVDYFLDQQAAVGQDERVRRAMSAVGRFASGLSGVSKEHDKHLAETFSR